MTAQRIPACWKVTYQTKNDAMTALRRIRKSGSPHRKETRAYQCPYCHLWHLTSRDS